jgi:sporulation protein YlmC with PRC-barrel domain
MATTMLRKLSDTGETVASTDEDVRGRKVLDDAGEEIGSVDGLMVDDENKVRFLRVESGGFLGLGGKHVMIPVEAVTRVMPHAVSIDRGRERLYGAPVYDPELVDDRDENYWGGVYGYYGFPPYGGMGMGMMGMGMGMNYMEAPRDEQQQQRLGHGRTDHPGH